MVTVPVLVLVPEHAMEVNTLCEETLDPPVVQAFFGAAGEFYDHHTGEILDRDATTAGIRAELTQMQEIGVFEWKRKPEKPPNEKVISTKMFHKAKGDEVRSTVVAREYADGVFALEHHAGTPPTWALKLVISRMMSKVEHVTRCVSCDLPFLAQKRRVGEASE